MSRSLLVLFLSALLSSAHIAAPTANRAPKIVSHGQPLNLHYQIHSRQKAMYPLQRRHHSLLRPSASYPGGVPLPPTSRMLAPESEGHYLPPQSPLLSQLHSFTPSTLRSEAEFARLERSNRELKLALERVEKADRWQRLQSEFRDISSSSSGAAAPLSQPLFYPFCSSSAAPAASPSRLGDSLGRSPFGTQQQQHQRRQSWRSYHDHQHTYLDHEQEYDGDDDDGDPTPPLSGRAKKQRLEDPPGVTRDLAIVNLDHVRFQVHIFCYAHL